MKWPVIHCGDVTQAEKRLSETKKKNKNKRTKSHCGVPVPVNNPE